MRKNIIGFFDRLEDKVRGKLSRSPIVYAFIGGIGVVLFWRGVWHLADTINLDAVLSIILGSIILLSTGVFVSAFVGNRLIITGLNGEKKLSDKTVEEIQSEESEIKKLQRTIDRIEDKIDILESEVKE